MSAPARPRAVTRLPGAGASQGASERKRTKQTGGVGYRDPYVRRAGQWLIDRRVAEFMRGRAERIVGRIDMVDLLLVAALLLLAAMFVWEPYWAHG